MILLRTTVAAGLALVAPLVLGVSGTAAGTAPDPLRETLRQQTAAAHSSCGGVQRTVLAGTDPLLVVRTAVEIGYNPCEVMRCALEKAAAPPGVDRETLCEQVIRGAASAAVQADVISRCSADACGSETVAAIIAAMLLEPDYRYLAPRALAAPDPLPPPERVIDRDLPRPQASPFTF